MLNWQDVESIFNQAIEQEPAHRQDFVDTKCGTDAELKDQVLALLNSEQDSSHYLENLSKNLYPIIETPTIGDTGRYKLREVIGEGGMGLVYKAFDESLQRVVALKFLSGIRNHNEKDKERFVQEAKTAAQINHPNVCEVYEVGESDDGSLFIVTAFCEGKDLSQLIKDNKLTLGSTISILLQLCSALQSAHKKNIIHRDVKPANIIVGNENHIQLVDFGIAKTLGNDISMSNNIMGTFAYMSPEQFSGASIDPRTDIWAVGIVLYECLTGQKPYAKDSPAEVMYQIFNGQLPQINEHLVPEFQVINTILRRCLSIDKQLRFQSVDLLGMELSALQRNLEKNVLLDFKTSYDLKSKSSNSIESTTINEYRKVVSIGIKIQKHKIKNSSFGIIKKHIKKYLGQISDQKDNVLFAYFGFPKLGEGSADNALACALALFNDDKQGQHDDGIKIERVVIDNTPIVLSKNTASQTQEVKGDLPGALSILMNCDLPHRLVVTQSANNRLRKPIAEQQRWSKTDFTNEDLYCFDPNEMEQPPLSVAAQFTSPLLGRVHELGLMESSWINVIEGEGKAVIVTGEAGMGKSRLIHEFSQNHSVLNTSHTLINCSCDPNRQETTFFPVIEGLKRFLSEGLKPNNEDVNALLQGLNLAQDNNNELLAWLLGIQSKKDSLFHLQQTPESLKHEAMLMLRRLMHALATQKPLIIIIEDLHWADTTTIEWLDSVLSSPLPNSVFLVLTGRPELFNRWRSYSVLNQLSLNRLSKTEAKDLVKYLSAQSVVGNSVIDALLEKTEGNPLFIEEYLKTIADKAIEGATSATTVFPDRLEDILLSRVDRLGTAKTVAQVASVIGRNFNYALLRQLLERKYIDNSNDLNRLIEAEIVFKQSEDQLLFKHALIRDALYESIDTQEKKSLHLLIAEVISTCDEFANDFPAETVAIHFSKSKTPIKSRIWWLKAVRDAERIFANNEVIRLCELGLEDNTACKNEKDYKEMELQFQMSLGKAVMSAKGYANSLAGESHQRAVNLGKQLNKLNEIIPSMVGLWSYLCVSAQHHKAQAVAAELVSYAESSESSFSDDLKVEAYMCSGITALFIGDIKRAKLEMELAINLYKPSMSLAHIRRYGQDPIVVLYSFYPVIEEALGDIDGALTSSDKCLQLAHKTNHPFSLAFALGFAVPIRIRQKRFEEAKKLIEENKNLCEQHGIHVFKLLGAVQLGILQQAQGQLEQGIKTLLENIPSYKAMGGQIFLAAWSAIMAMSYLQLGKFEQARREIENGIQQMQNTNEWFNKPILDAVSTQLELMLKKIGESDK